MPKAPAPAAGPSLPKRRPSAAELRPVWQEPAGPPIHHKGLSIMELPRLAERELCRRYIPARAHSIFRGAKPPVTGATGKAKRKGRKRHG